MQDIEERFAGVNVRVVVVVMVVVMMVMVMVVVVVVVVMMMMMMMVVVVVLMVMVVMVVMVVAPMGVYACTIAVLSIINGQARYIYGVKHGVDTTFARVHLPLDMLSLTHSLTHLLDLQQPPTRGW